MGKPLILEGNWLYRWIRSPNVSYSMCNFYGATTTANGWFLRKPHFTMEIFKFWEPVKWGGLKIIGPKYQKAHPYAKSGRTNRLADVAVALVWRYTMARKKVRENRHWKVVVYNTTPLLLRRDNNVKSMVLGTTNKLPDIIIIICTAAKWRITMHFTPVSSLVMGTKINKVTSSSITILL